MPLRSRVSVWIAAVMLPALVVVLGAHSQQVSTSPGSLADRLQAKFQELHAGRELPGWNGGFALADGRSIGIAVGVSDRIDARRR